MPTSIRTDLTTVFPLSRSRPAPPYLPAIFHMTLYTGASEYSPPHPGFVTPPLRSLRMYNFFPKSMSLYVRSSHNTHSCTHTNVISFFLRPTSRGLSWSLSIYPPYPPTQAPYDPSNDTRRNFLRYFQVLFFLPSCPPTLPLGVGLAHLHLYPLSLSTGFAS
jgi:hypothetical protein